MSLAIIPLTNDPNQDLAVTLPGDNGNIPVRLLVTWNRIAGYWTMTISDSSDTPLITYIPLLASDGIYGDLMAQFKYLNLGTFFVTPLSENLNGVPGLGDWGVNYTLAWGD